MFLWSIQTTVNVENLRRNYYTSIARICQASVKYFFAISLYSAVCSVAAGFRYGRAFILFVPSSTSFCYRRAFYLDFMQFTILHVRRTSSSILEVRHSWRGYCFHNAHPLRSTVTVVYCLPRCYPLNNLSML